MLIDMKNTILSLLLLLFVAASCDKNDDPVPPSGDMPIQYIDYCTIEGEGLSYFLFHGDSSPLYIKIKTDPSPYLAKFVEDGTHRALAAFELPTSFDASLINKVDTVVVKGAKLLSLIPIETHDVLSAAEADVAGILSVDNTHPVTTVEATGCRGYITVKGMYGYYVSNDDKTPVNVYLYVDEGRCKSDVLALQLVYTREDIDGYDLLRYETRTECFALKSLKSRYGAASNVTVEIRSRGNLLKSFKLLGSDFTSPID